MSYFSGYELLLLFCRVQKGQDTAKPNVCRVSNSSTRQRFNGGGRPAHVKPSSPCVVAEAHGELWLRRVPIQEHTAN